MLFLRLIQDPITLIAFVVGIVVAITFHEFAHAWTANRLGDATPKYQGRLSLNPFAHLDPIGTIFLFVAGIGWGKPVLYNPNNLKRGKYDEFLIAISGPLTNIIMAFIFALPYRIAVLTGHLGLIDQPIVIIANFITELNLILAVFNLIPIPPLDGSKFLYLFLPENAKLTLEKLGLPILISFFIIIFVFKVDFFGRIIFPIINWLEYWVRIFPGSPV